MAGITTEITLKDGVTPAVTKMLAVFENLERVLTSVDARFRDAFDAESIRAAQTELANAAELTKHQENQIKDIEASIAKKEHERLNIAEEITKVKSREFFKNSRISDLIKRQNVAVTSQRLMISENVKRKTTLLKLEGKIAEALSAEERDETQIRDLLETKDILTDRIAHTQAKIEQSTRIQKKLENDINVVKASAPATENEVIGLKLKQNKLLTEEALLYDRIDGILDKCISDQAKLAAQQAKRVQDALDGVAKEKAAFSNLMDVSYAQLQKEEKAKNAAASKQLQQQEQLRQKAEQRLRVERVISMTETFHSKALASVTDKYHQAHATVIQLERTTNSVNKAEMQQLALARGICNEREKIMNLTNRLVGIRTRLNVLEVEGKNKTLEATSARREEVSIRKQIANHARIALNLERQSKTAIENNRRAQEQFNNSLRNACSNAAQLTSRLKSMIGAYVGIQTAGSLIKTADSLAANDARLSLMVKEGESVAQLNEQIYAAAMRSRSGYLAMADSISKVGIQAGNLFDNSGDMVRFMETFSKMAVISKSTTQQTNAAMTQLIQALSFGQLRGDELKSILENMPMVAQVIADEMTRVGGFGDLPDKLRHIAADGKVTADEICELGYEGEIAAQTIVNAMLNGAAKIDKMANNMTWTWAQVWEVCNNAATKAFTPIFEKISAIIQSEQFKRFATWVDHAMNRASTACVKMWDLAAPIFAGIFDWLAAIGNFISDNWSFIAPVIWGIIGALTALKVAAMVSAAWTAGLTAVKIALTFITWLCSGATLAQAAAQWGLNSALLACPIVWIIAAIVALIVVFYLIIAAVNHFCGTSISATGLILAAFAWLVSNVWNILVGLWNMLLSAADFVFDIILGVVEWFLNAMNGGFDGFAGSCANLVGQIIGWFLSLGKVVTTIIDAIFGTNWTDGLESLKSKVTAWGKNEKAVTIERDWSTRKLAGNRLDVFESMESSYKFGDDLSKTVEGSFDNNKLNKVLDKVTGERTGAEKGDFSKALEGGFSDDKRDSAAQDYAKQIAGNTDDIAKNTGDTADNTDTSENFKYMRQLAERDYMNRSQLMNFKVDMSNVNNIRSGMDYDEMMGRMARDLYHEFVAKMEGV